MTWKSENQNVSLVSKFIVEFDHPTPAKILQKASRNINSCSSFQGHLQQSLKYLKYYLLLYFITPRTGSSTQLTENRTTLNLSFLISPGVSTNSVVKVFIKQRRY